MTRDNRKFIFTAALLICLMTALHFYGFAEDTTTLSPAAASLSDVPEHHWAYDAVSKLARAGIIKGNKSGKFNGNAPLTRYEMAKMTDGLVKFLEEHLGIKIQKIQDSASKTQNADKKTQTPPSR